MMGLARKKLIGFISLLGWIRPSTRLSPRNIPQWSFPDHDPSFHFQKTLHNHLHIRGSSNGLNPIIHLILPPTPT